MASGRKGKPEGKGIAPVTTSDYGMRAAMALNHALPGEHRDKLVARMFGCSVRMAKYLRAGQYWTIDRLNQASAVIGDVFDIALSPATDDKHYAEMADIEALAERLARLEANVGTELVAPKVPGLAPQESEAVVGSRGAPSENVGDIAGARGGASAPRQASANPGSAAPGSLTAAAAPDRGRAL